MFLVYNIIILFCQVYNLTHFCTYRAKNLRFLKLYYQKCVIIAQ